MVDVPGQLVARAREAAGAAPPPWVVEVNPHPSDAPGLAGLVDARVIAPSTRA